MHKIKCINHVQFGWHFSLFSCYAFLWFIVIACSAFAIVFLLHLLSLCCVVILAYSIAVFEVYSLFSVCRYYFSLNVKLLFYLHWRWTIHIIFAFANMHFYCSCSGNDSEEAVKLQYRWYCTICCFVMRKWAFSYCNRALSCFFFFFLKVTLWRSKHFIP